MTNSGEELNHDCLKLWAFLQHSYLLITKQLILFVKVKPNVSLCMITDTFTELRESVFHLKIFVQCFLAGSTIAAAIDTNKN